MKILIKNTFRDVGRFALSGLLALSVAACGGGGGSAGAVPGAPDSSKVAGSVSLIFSSTELKSAGTAGTEVTVTALVKSSNNTAIEGVPVTFSADSGALMNMAAESDKNGQATASLGTSGDRTNRKITVMVVAGGKSASGSVNVVGTSVTLVGTSTITAGGTGDFTITVKDSANVAVANAPVTITSLNGNGIAVKTSGGGTAAAPLTNSQGQVVVTLTASQSGNDTLSVATQGTSTNLAVSVNASKLTMQITEKTEEGLDKPTSTGNTSTSCHKIVAHYEIVGQSQPQSGTVNINTSRGKIYSDLTCLSALTSSSVPLVSGDSQPTYLKSDTAGIATVTASITNGPTVQANVEFVAAWTLAATVSLQAEPAVIGTNAGTGQAEKSTLTAIVRDGTINNNVVKGAVVEFSVVEDQSGGALSNPSVVTTGSDGSASVTFIAGTATTPQNGVTIKATIQGTTKVVTIPLTVSKKSLFIAAGTGNKLLTPSDTTYQQDYAVFVTDAAGNPVPGVTVTAAVIPTRYFTGSYAYDDVVAKAWKQTLLPVEGCENEDTNQNGILDLSPKEDTNDNDVLDPGIPLNVSSSGTTDANGSAKISILYPRDRANWTKVKVIIRGTVAGTESTYTVQSYTLPILAADLSDKNVPPPGYISPYGVDNCGKKN